ncbi:hypothetical protein EYC84_007241 [Monilinia fructicola]|uniref:Uncharacterized protein n=1 Tax=Monilinia fructicola TaxID=38448 RepID=A0A5M9K6K6_MONFR|nr:hypothetical protein EYC84_007241 [Monilinia fructicola]
MDGWTIDGELFLGELAYWVSSFDQLRRDPIDDSTRVPYHTIHLTVVTKIIQYGISATLPYNAQTLDSRRATASLHTLISRVVRSTAQHSTAQRITHSTHTTPHLHSTAALASGRKLRMALRGAYDGIYESCMGIAREEACWSR